MGVDPTATPRADAVYVAAFRAVAGRSAAVAGHADHLADAAVLNYRKVNGAHTITALQAAALYNGL